MRWALTSALLVACVVSSSGPAFAEALATESVPTAVSAAGPYVAWSREVPGPGVGLVLDGPGGPRLLHVAPRSRPFDVAVGRTAAGAFVLTYSRCRYARSRQRCRLFEYDIAHRRERRLPGSPQTAGRETMPARWGRRLVYVGVDRRRPALGPRLYVRDVGERRAKPLAAGTLPARARVLGLALRGPDIVFLWHTATWSDGCGRGGDDHVSYDDQYEIWQGRIGGDVTLLDRTCGSGDRATEIASPALSRGVASYMITVSPGVQHLRMVRDGTYRESEALAQTTSWAVPATGGLVSVQRADPSRAEWEIVRGPLPPLASAAPLESGTLFGPEPGSSKPFGP